MNDESAVNIISRRFPKKKNTDTAHQYIQKYLLSDGVYVRKVMIALSTKHTRRI